jgi:hypothetical protein
MIHVGMDPLQNHITAGTPEPAGGVVGDHWRLPTGATLLVSRLSGFGEPLRWRWKQCRAARNTMIRGSPYGLPK